MRLMSPIIVATALAGCAPAVTTPICPHAAMTETRLYFGLSEPSGRIINDRAFADFVAKDVTPRIPAGFTIHQGRGFWKDEASPRTISEDSRILVHLHQASPETNAALDAIADAYKARFRQQAVMRTDSVTCVEFR